MKIRCNKTITIELTEFECEFLCYYVENTFSTFKSHIDTSPMKAQYELMKTISEKLQEIIPLPLV